MGDKSALPAYPAVGFESDAHYSMADGDVLPRVATGRLSTNDPDELAAIVEELIHYPRDDDPTWRRRVLLAGWRPRLDRNEDAHDAGWRCLEEIGTHFEPVCRFQHLECGVDPQQSIWPTSTKQSLIDALAEGVLVLRYVGHGQDQEWSNVGVDTWRVSEKFVSGDIDRVSPVGRLPLVLSLSCATGGIAPATSFAERWQVGARSGSGRPPEPKAIGIFAADVETDTWWNDRIAPLLFHQIVTAGKRRVGDILLSAIRQLDQDFANDPLYAVCRRSAGFYRYFGDPDTMLADPHLPIVEQGRSRVQSISAREAVVAKQSERRVSTAVRSPEGELEIRSWNVGPTITARGRTAVASDTLPGVDLAVWGSTGALAFRRHDDTLGLARVALSRLPSRDALTLVPDARAEVAKGIGVAAVAAGWFVTAVRTANDRLKLISWQAQQGSLLRRHETLSTVRTGTVKELSILALEGARQVVTACQMKKYFDLGLWSVSDDGQISELAWNVRARQVAFIQTVADSRRRVIASFRDCDGRLRLVCWQVADDGSQITYLSDTSMPDGPIRGNALAVMSSGVVSAIRTAADRLRLVYWQLTGDGRLVQVGESAPMSSAGGPVALCPETLGVAETIVSATAHRLGREVPRARLRLTAWQR